ncbi:MAG: DUF4325 domain-containing protein [Bacteroidetes bacterium]|nr:DUF4325 domain-containing protein [Bacteroidota bacterium]
MKTISVSEVIGKSSAVLHSDGLILYEVLKRSGSRITLSFNEIVHCTTAFLNASIGKFIIEAKGTNVVLDFQDISEDVKNKIDLVLENARDEKKRANLDASARGYLYT